MQVPPTQCTAIQGSAQQALNASMLLYTWQRPCFQSSHFTLLDTFCRSPWPATLFVEVGDTPSAPKHPPNTHSFLRSELKRVREDSFKIRNAALAFMASAMTALTAAVVATTSKINAVPLCDIPTTDAPKPVWPVSVSVERIVDQQLNYHAVYAGTIHKTVQCLRQFK